MSKAKPPSSPPPSSLVMHQPPRKVARLSQEVPAVDGRRASTKLLRDWETFEFSVECWSELMDELDVDVAARRALFVLAQSDKEGANDVVWKVVKKMADGVPIANGSAFVHTNVKNARHRWSSLKMPTS